MNFKIFNTKIFRYEARARREVVLSAGSIGSAQLLMVSGVGPAHHLHDLDIKPIVDLPVGYNLQDHVTFSGNAFIVNSSKLCINDVSSNDNIKLSDFLRSWYDIATI